MSQWPSADFVSPHCRENGHRRIQRIDLRDVPKNLLKVACPDAGDESGKQKEACFVTHVGVS